MKKALLILLFITALPVVASAESVHILTSVQSNHNYDFNHPDNETSFIGSDTDAISIRYISNSGVGIGFTNVDTYSESSRVNSSSLTYDRLHIKFKALEISYTMRYLTFGLGTPISGIYREESTGASAESPLSGRTYYKVAGSTGFAELQLRIFDKGALLIGYHISSLKLKNASGSKSDTINNIMLGFRIPI